MQATLHGREHFVLDGGAPAQGRLRTFRHDRRGAYRTAFALSLLTVFATAARAGHVQVTTCAQEVVDQVAELAVDLDCTGTPTRPGVDLTRATLLLNGHSVTGGGYAVVACSDHCTIVGPGTLSGNESGVSVNPLKDRPAKLRVRDVTVTGNNLFGLAAERVFVTGSTITNNGGFNGEGGGVIGSEVTVHRSTISGNFDFGICAGRTRAGFTTVQSNGTSAGCSVGTVTTCPAGPCGDLITTLRPKLGSHSACDVSVDPGVGTWRVCSADGP